jgi:hypothetical protein
MATWVNGNGMKAVTGSRAGSSPRLQIVFISLAVLTAGCFAGSIPDDVTSEDAAPLPSLAYECGGSPGIQRTPDVCVVSMRSRGESFLEPSLMLLGGGNGTVVMGASVIAVPLTSTTPQTELGGIFSFRLFRLDADGQTWIQANRPELIGSAYTDATLGAMTSGPDGEWHIVLYAWNPAMLQAGTEDLVISSSNDKGESWTTPTKIMSSAGEVRLVATGIGELVVLAQDGTGHPLERRINFLRSNDGGKSWHHAHPAANAGCILWGPVLALGDNKFQFACSDLQKSETRIQELEVSGNSVDVRTLRSAKIAFASLITLNDSFLALVGSMNEDIVLLTIAERDVQEWTPYSLRKNLSVPESWGKLVVHGAVEWAGRLNLLYAEDTKYAYATPRIPYGFDREYRFGHAAIRLPDEVSIEVRLTPTETVGGVLDDPKMMPDYEGASEKDSAGIIVDEASGTLFLAWVFDRGVDITRVKAIDAGIADSSA